MIGSLHCFPFFLPYYIYDVTIVPKLPFAHANMLAILVVGCNFSCTHNAISPAAAGHILRLFQVLMHVTLRFS